MASVYDCGLRVGNAVSVSSNAAHVDALCVESLQGSARRARGTRPATAEQTIVLPVPDKRKGRVYTFVTN